MGGNPQQFAVIPGGCHHLGNLDYYAIEGIYHVTVIPVPETYIIKGFGIRADRTYTYAANVFSPSCPASARTPKYQGSEPKQFPRRDIQCLQLLNAC
jgi:hypothetical protein